MPNHGNSDEELTDYTFQSHQRADGKTVKITRNLAGVVVSEDLISAGRIIERGSFHHRTGALTGRTAYEWDDQRKPLRTTTYDAEGDIVLMNDRGLAPVVGELYRGEKPFHIYPKKMPNKMPEPTPTG